MKVRYVAPSHYKSFFKSLQVQADRNNVPLILFTQLVLQGAFPAVKHTGHSGSKVRVLMPVSEPAYAELKQRAKEVHMTITKLFCAIMEGKAPSLSASVTCLKTGATTANMLHKAAASCKMAVTDYLESQMGNTRHQKSDKKMFSVRYGQVLYLPTSVVVDLVNYASKHRITLSNSLTRLITLGKTEVAASAYAKAASSHTDFRICRDQHRELEKQAAALGIYTHEFLAGVLFGYYKFTCPAPRASGTSSMTIPHDLYMHLYREAIAQNKSVRFVVANILTGKAKTLDAAGEPPGYSGDKSPVARFVRLPLAVYTALSAKAAFNNTVASEYLSGILTGKYEQEPLEIKDTAGSRARHVWLSEAAYGALKRRCGSATFSEMSSYAVEMLAPGKFDSAAVLSNADALRMMIEQAVHTALRDLTANPDFLDIVCNIRHINLCTKTDAKAGREGW